MLRGSSLHRAMACPTSEVLPHSEDQQTEAATRGVEVHAYLENVGNGMDHLEALALVPPDYRADCESIPLDKLPVSGGHRTEVSMAYCVATGVAREVSRDGTTYPDLTRTEVPCTADVMGTLGNSTYIADYKTGRSWIPAPAENPQLLLGALCATKLLGKSSAVVEIIKLSEPTNPVFLRAEVGAFDLAAFAARLRNTARQVGMTGGEVRIVPHEGEHCRYCPAFEACPAKQRGLTNILSGDYEHHAMMVWAQLNERNEAEAYRQFKFVAELKKRMERRFMAYARSREGGVDLGNGRRYGLVEKEGNERVDGNVAWEVMDQMYGAEFANEACGFTTSKAAMEKMVRSRAPRGKAAGQLRELMQRLRDAGAISRKKESRLMEYTPKKELKAG